MGTCCPLVVGFLNQGFGEKKEKQDRGKDGTSVHVRVQFKLSSFRGKSHLLSWYRIISFQSLVSVSQSVSHLTALIV